MNSQQMGEHKANLCDPKPDQSQQGESSQAHNPTPDCGVVDDHELLRGRQISSGLRPPASQTLPKGRAHIQECFDGKHLSFRVLFFMIQSGVDIEVGASRGSIVEE